MLYCQVCCEPFHQFCLEPAERPSEENKENWCCRRCKFCHVCGRKNKYSKVQTVTLLVLLYSIYHINVIHLASITFFSFSLCWSVKDARTVITVPVWDLIIQNITRRGKLGWVFCMLLKKNTYIRHTCLL